MLQTRRSDERGHFDHGWLDTYHTFSFAAYRDPNFMGFRSLRVINEDRVQAGRGFGAHPHRDMEIITYVLEGALEHRDNLGNGSILRPGELQHMTAGSGIEHSEFNPSPTDPVHLYQIWLLPDRRGLRPEYDQRMFREEEKRGRWRVVASPDGRDESLTIHQDAVVYLSLLAPGEELGYELPAGRHAWLQVLRGMVELDSEQLTAGDGVAASDEQELRIGCNQAAELMLFDLA